MIISRKYFSKSEETKKNKENNPEYILDQGIVGGTTTALIGGGLLASNKYLTSKGIDVPRVKNMKRVGMVALPVGATLAGVSAYKKIKNKKSKK